MLGFSESSRGLYFLSLGLVGLWLNQISKVWRARIFGISWGPGFWGQGFWI